MLRPGGGEAMPRVQKSVKGRQAGNRWFGWYTALVMRLVRCCLGLGVGRCIYLAIDVKHFLFPASEKRDRFANTRQGAESAVSEGGHGAVMDVIEPVPITKENDDW